MNDIKRREKMRLDQKFADATTIGLAVLNLEHNFRGDIAELVLQGLVDQHSRRDFLRALARQQFGIPPKFRDEAQDIIEADEALHRKQQDAARDSRLKKELLRNFTGGQPPAA